MDSATVDLITTTILEVLTAMGVSAEVEFEESLTKGLVFNIATQDSYVLIGQRGAHLQALQVLAQAIVAKKMHAFVPFMIDVDDYKRKREWYLKETAKQAVEKAKRIGKPVSLEPMPNFERKIVHAYLQEHYPNVISNSVGYEPRRKIVIRFGA